MKFSIFRLLAVLLLIYMVWPGPGSIADFKPLPSSIKSKLAGDTYQIPNVAGYFSDNYRQKVISFYLTNYWQKTFLPFPPLKLNHPPEYSWTVIKKHTDSTYLEELVYPLRNSLYVNGFEPFNEDKTPKFWGSAAFIEDGKIMYTKTTLRYYPSSLVVRILVWLGIVVSVSWLIKLGRRIILN